MIYSSTSSLQGGEPEPLSSGERYETGSEHTDKACIDKAYTEQLCDPLLVQLFPSLYFSSQYAYGCLLNMEVISNVSGNVE